MERLSLWRQVTVACTLACVLAGCSSYVCPSLPEGVSAKLASGHPDLKLKKIDGKSVPFGRRSGVVVAPGPHEIDMLFHRETAGEMLSTRVQHAETQLHMEAVAGREYTVQCLLVGYQMAFWIEEVSSGQTIAGVKPQLPRRDDASAPPAGE